MTVPPPGGTPFPPPPRGSAWGRTAARIYLALAAAAIALTVADLAAGRPGLGTLAISVLTAPWSLLLSFLARALAPALDPSLLRGIGMVLMVLSVLLNARVLYGVAARAEADARAARSSGGASHG